MGFTSDIYLSYSHMDTEIVQPLVRQLKSRLQDLLGRSVSVWIDVSGIKAGDNWSDALKKACNSSRTMVAIISPSYLYSDLTRGEYEAFQKLDRPMFPVVLTQLRPDTQRLNELVGDADWIAVPRFSPKRSNKQYDEVVAQLAEQIADVLTKSERGLTSERSSASTAPATPAKGYVFLSYAEEDADFLEQLRSFFGEHGYAYWEFEKSDRDFQKRIDLELEDVITNAVATVSVLSESWKTSDWSVRELYFSKEIGKPVFLLKAKPFKPILAISGLPYIDFTRDSDDAFSRLAKELRRAGL